MSQLIIPVISRCISAGVILPHSFIQEDVEPINNIEGEQSVGMSLDVNINENGQKTLTV